MTPCADRDRLTPSRRHDPLPPFLRSPSWPVDVRQLADVVHLDTTSPAKRAAAIAQVHDDFRAVVGGEGPCRSVVEAILTHSFWYPLEGHTAERRHQRSLTRPVDDLPERRVFLVGDTIGLDDLAHPPLELVRQGLQERRPQDPFDLTHSPANVHRHAVVIVQADQNALIPLDDRVHTVTQQISPLVDLTSLAVASAVLGEHVPRHQQADAPVSGSSSALGHPVLGDQASIPDDSDLVTQEACSPVTRMGDEGLFHRQGELEFTLTELAQPISNVPGLARWPHEPQEKVVRVTHMGKSPVVGVARVFRAQLAAFSQEAFDLFAVFSLPCLLDKTADASVRW